MAKPQHETVEYRRIRKQLALVVAAGDGWCSEPRCLFRSRWIPPGSKWHVCHDPSGTVVLGPGHAKCNLSEAAVRGNKMRAPRRAYWW